MWVRLCEGEGGGDGLGLFPACRDLAWHSALQCLWAALPETILPTALITYSCPNPNKLPQPENAPPPYLETALP